MPIPLLRTLPKTLLLTLSASLLINPLQALEQQTIQSASIPRYVDLEATLEAVNQSTVSAQTSGAIKAVHFDVNDQVEAGALLIEIDDTQQQAQLQQARANLAQAQAQNEDAQVLLQRNTRLYEQRTLSKGEFDSSNARAKSAAAAVKAAEAALKQAQEQLAYTKVKAPYGGIVRARHVQMGELVIPGQPLMTGLALEPLRAVADLPQQVARQYQSADQISIQLQHSQLQPTEVVLFPFADERHHSVRLRAELPAGSLDGEQRLFPGQWAKIRVLTGERNGILVPTAAILQRAELNSVYVIHNGEPRLRQVRTGERFEGQTEILAGLQTGDVIVTDALAQLAAISRKEQ